MSERAFELVCSALEQLSRAVAMMAPENSKHASLIPMGRYRIDDPRVSFSVRTKNCIDSEGIWDMGVLDRTSDATLLHIRNFGRSCLAEVRRNLDHFRRILAEESVGAITSPSEQAHG